jgi:hypothetical protein
VNRWNCNVTLTVPVLSTGLLMLTHLPLPLMISRQGWKIQVPALCVWEARKHVALHPVLLQRCSNSIFGARFTNKFKWHRQNCESHGCSARFCV